MSLLKVNRNNLAESLNFIKPQTLRSKSKSDKVYIGVTRYLPEEHEFPILTFRSRLHLSVGMQKLLDEKYNDITNKIIIDPLTNTQKKEYKIAFSLEGGENDVVCLNPEGNITFFKFKKNKARAELNNRIFVNQLYEHFKIDKLNIIGFDMELKFLINLSGLHLYNITVTNLITLEEAERKNRLRRKIKP